VEKIDLTSADYWNGPGIDVRLNPRRSHETEGLSDALRDVAGIESAVVLATSGSEGRVKYVTLTKTAMLASARAVNAHSGIGSEDVWLAGLSTFHVGGLSIYSRAFLSGSRVEVMPWDKWQKSGGPFVNACRERQVTVTSLTPVHLFDLVENRVKCPPSLRGVFIGGGALSRELGHRALELGWPLWPTYGMTETASQVATSRGGDPEWLPILDGWETSVDQAGRLKIRGQALFSGYLTRRETPGNWKFDSARDEGGWFTTGDRVDLIDGKLKFAGRFDDLVKVSGELVSVSKLERDLGNLGLKAAVIPRPHPRRGNLLVAFVEGGCAELKKARQFNEGKTGLEKLAEIIPLEKLPDTQSGKIDQAALKKLAKCQGDDVS